MTLARSSGGEPSSPDKLPAGLGWLLGVLLFLAGLAMMLKHVLPNPLDYSLGDNGDGLVLLATLEHWWRVLNGVPVGGTWRQAGFFYPMANPIGLTDSYLGLAVPYCVFRLCALSPFSAFTATMVVFASIGYWSAYGFCRATGLAGRAAAILSAWIFAFGAVSLFLAGHAQTYTLMLSPIMGLGLLRAWRSRAGPARAAWGLMAGLVYGLILLTAPQTAWFGTFVGGLVLVIYLLLRRPPIATAHWAVPQGAGFVVGVLVGLAVTVIVNRPDQGPIHRRTGGEIDFYSPQASDILHQPIIELPWNDLAGRVGLLADQSRPIVEIALGYGPLLLLTLLVGCGIIAFRWSKAPRRRVADAIVLACVAAPLLCWLIQLRLFRVSGWRVLVRILPGGMLIRTPFRIQDACVMFALIALAVLFTRLAAGSFRFRSVLAGALFLLLLAEQMSMGLGVRQTSELTGWFARVGRPPAACKSFYVVPGAGPPAPWFEYQSKAMVLAEWIGLPTLNGNSSWYPDGWEPMRDVVSPGYQAAVAAWVAQNHLRDVCQLDASSAQWTLEPNRPPA